MLNDIVPSLFPSKAMHLYLSIPPLVHNLPRALTGACGAGPTTHDSCLRESIYDGAKSCNIKFCEQISPKMMLINFVDGAVILVPSEHALPLAAIKTSELCCLLYFLIFDILIFKSSAFAVRR